MSLGKQIRLYRERAGLTLEQLSERAEVDVGTISALEQRDSGRSKYTARLAGALGLTVEQLFDETHTYQTGGATHFAGEVVTLYGPTPATGAWPFALSYPRYMALSDRDRGRIDGYMLALAEAHESSPKKISSNGAPHSN